MSKNLSLVDNQYLPELALNLFQPIHERNYVTTKVKKIVALGIGVHMGPPADGKVNIPLQRHGIHKLGL